MAFQNWSCFLPSLTPFPTCSLELAGSFRLLQEAVSAAVHERVRLVQTQSSCSHSLEKDACGSARAHREAQTPAHPPHSPLLRWDVLSHWCVLWSPRHTESTLVVCPIPVAENTRGGHDFPHLGLLWATFGSKRRWGRAEAGTHQETISELKHQDRWRVEEGSVQGDKL